MATYNRPFTILGALYDGRSYVTILDLLALSALIYNGASLLALRTYCRQATETRKTKKELLFVCISFVSYLAVLIRLNLGAAQPYLVLDNVLQHNRGSCLYPLLLVSATLAP